VSILFIVERFHDSGTAFDAAERMAGRGEEVVILFTLSLIHISEPTRPY